MSHTAECESPRHPNWRPIEIVAIVIAFLINFAAGIVVLVWRMWKHFGSPRTRQDFGRVARSIGVRFDNAPRSSVKNSAFEEYKRETLEKLERERRTLHDEEREFDAFLRDLHRAKDRDEFDRFMATRCGSTA